MRVDRRRMGGAENCGSSGATEANWGACWGAAWRQQLRAQSESAGGADGFALAQQAWAGGEVRARREARVRPKRALAWQQAKAWATKKIPASSTAAGFRNPCRRKVLIAQIYHRGRSGPSFLPSWQDFGKRIFAIGPGSSYSAAPGGPNRPAAFTQEVPFRAR
jgi:hypothetical protein